MLYRVHDTKNNLFCAFDPELDRLSRWKHNPYEVDLNDGYSFKGNWFNIRFMNHDELVHYFKTHETYILIETPVIPYEYW